MANTFEQPTSLREHSMGDAIFVNVLEFRKKMDIHSGTEHFNFDCKLVAAAENNGKTMDAIKAMFNDIPKSIIDAYLEELCFQTNVRFC